MNSGARSDWWTCVSRASANQARTKRCARLRVKKHFDTFREKDCGLLKISQFSGRNPDQTNCFSAACALKKPDAAYTPPRLIHLDFLRNLF